MVSDSTMRSSNPREVGLQLQHISPPGQFWCGDTDEDSAACELRALLGQKGQGGAQVYNSSALASRRHCLSGASTNATTTPRCSTPPPPTTTPPPASAHDRAGLGLSPLKAPQYSLRDRSRCNQSRKVFVGGIPQHMGEVDFQKVFLQFGAIDRAWLQWVHLDELEACANERKHRGFGFVVFQEASAIDTLLGSETSKYIWLGECVRLEVKRAVVKGEAPLTATEAEPRSRRRQNHRGQCSAAPQQWASHNWLYGPCLPPHTLVESPEAEEMGHLAMPLSKPHHYDTVPTTQLPASAIAPAPTLCESPLYYPMQPMAASPSRECMINALLEGFCGEKPQDGHELERVLRDATPEYYDE